MTKNMNGNSNQIDEVNVEEDQTHCVLEETREVVRKFLQRSLSQNAKNSMTFLKPEGYHKLKQEGKLGHYHGQSSKSYDGSHKNQIVFRRKSLSNTHESSWSGGKTLSSLRELRNETNDHEHNRFNSVLDVRTMQKLSESDTPNFYHEKSLVLQLLGSESTVVDGCLQSLDSSSSTFEEQGNKTRRKSFTKAVSNEPMLSDSNNKKNQTGEQNNEHQRNKHAHVIEDQARIKPNNFFPSLDDAAISHGGKPEKKFSFRQRIKRIMPSNIRKLKSRKTIEISRKEDTVDGPNKSDAYRALSAEPRFLTSIDPDFNSRETERNSQSSTATAVHSFRPESSKTHSLKRKTLTPSRTPSPNKGKSPLATPKFFHLPFSHKKSSPKLKSRSFHQSSSSYNLSLTVPHAVSEQMEKNKSGSLPNSVRLSVNQPPVSKPTNQRPSEDMSTNKAQKHSSATPSRSASHREDLSIKRTRSSKIRKLFRVFRKRRASESSTTSSRSVSLPSIPAAVDQDECDRELPKADGITSSVSDEVDHSILAPSDDHRYHHRGSMSLSSVNLDRLSDPEKQKIYDEIADSLSRLSTKFAKHMQNRLKDSKTNQLGFDKEPPPRPLSQQRSPKKEHLFDPNEVRPSLSAYYNLTPRKRKDARLDKSAAVMPGSIPPRRVYHSQSRSLDSRKDYHGHVVVPNIILEKPASDDVVDGFTPITEEVMETDEHEIASNVTGTSLRFSGDGSDVGTSQVFEDEVQSREDRPSTSNGFPSGSPREEYDEDKLVELLVKALREKGDQFQDSVDMANGVPLGPALGAIGRVTYSKFQSVAARFCSNCRRLVERSPSRHPEIFSVVMVVNIAELICNMATSETAAQAANVICNYTTRYVTEFVEERGNTWDEVLTQLRDTENELNEVESSPEKRPPSDSEVD